MAEPSLSLNIEDVNKCSSGTVLANNIKIGPWGVSGVSNFDFGRSSSRIIKVEIYSGAVIDSLTMCYAVDQDILTTYTAGGPGGSRQELLELSSDEYINSMVGYIGTYCGEGCITKLEFTSNLGKSWKYGEGGGTKFTVPVIDGRIVGFFGQFTQYINEIGVYLAS